MVSLWPWRGDDTSPASFEKALSTLSVKITKSQLLLDTLRQRSRRLKALWTLYMSFAYILCVVILALVVGWNNWGVWEYSALSGSPLVIYLIRTGISTFYTYRIENATHRLEEQQTERVKTIDKLKAATKYNSTQQLLEKYGGAPPIPSPKPKSKSPARTPRGIQKQPQRTGIGPPPTANIPRIEAPSQPSTPQSRQPVINPERPVNTPGTPVSNVLAGQAEFAPNAFSGPSQYDLAGELNSGGRWYDRFLDILLGEDETSPKNRIILICKYCRLVNGQAPPGTKRMEELGEWKCIGCRGLNGVVDEGTKMVQEMKQLAQAETTIGQTDGVVPSNHKLVKNSDEYEGADDDLELVDHEDEPENPTRRRKLASPKTAPGLNQKK